MEAPENIILTKKKGRPCKGETHADKNEDITEYIRNYNNTYYMKVQKQKRLDKQNYIICPTCKMPVMNETQPIKRHNLTKYHTKFLEGGITLNI